MKSWIALAALLLADCSGEVIRGQAQQSDLTPLTRDQERNKIVEQGQQFCSRYPDDVACKGPKR